MRHPRTIVAGAALIAAFFISGCVTTPEEVACDSPIQVLPTFIADVHKRNPGVTSEFLGGEFAEIFIASMNRTFGAEMMADIVIIFSLPEPSMHQGVGFSHKGCVVFFDNIPTPLVDAWKAGRVPTQRSS